MQMTAVLPQQLCGRAAHPYLALPLVFQHNLRKALARGRELRAVGLHLLQLHRHKGTLFIKEISISTNGEPKALQTSLQ